MLTLTYEAISPLWKYIHGIHSVLYYLVLIPVASLNLYGIWLITFNGTIREHVRELDEKFSYRPPKG